MVNQHDLDVIAWNRKEIDYIDNKGKLHFTNRVNSDYKYLLEGSRITIIDKIHNTFKGYISTEEEIDSWESDIQRIIEA